jgi:hypothetical protein
VRKRAETHVMELGEALVTTDHMATLAARRFGDNFPSKRPDPTPDGKQAAEKKGPPGDLPWTTEAQRYLEELPAFLRDGVYQVACDVARTEGRLEVNIKLLQRLEAEDTPGRRLPWDTEAEQLIDGLMSDRSPATAMFVRPGMESAAERETLKRNGKNVSKDDVEKVITTDGAGVEWDPQALARVETAPDFIRAGIKKAAEFNARREGLTRIGSDDLTRFRNRAMMRAVRRMKGFGMKNLDFGAFDIARNRVPRLKGNEQAAERFSEIREYVQSKQAPDGGGLGVLDKEMLDRMKAELGRK